RDEEVAAVPAPLRVRERLRHLEGEAVSLPIREPAGQGHGVLVAELPERLRGEGGAVARRTVDDQGPVLVRNGLLDSGLEVPARHVHGPRDVALLPLVALPYVDDDRPVAVLETR